MPDGAVPVLFLGCDGGAGQFLGVLRSIFHPARKVQNLVDRARSPVVMSVSDKSAVSFYSLRKHPKKHDVKPIVVLIVCDGFEWPV